MKKPPTFMHDSSKSPHTEIAGCFGESRGYKADENTSAVRMSNCAGTKIGKNHKRLQPKCTTERPNLLIASQLIIRTKD